MPWRQNFAGQWAKYYFKELPTKTGDIRQRGDNRKGMLCLCGVTGPRAGVALFGPSITSLHEAFVKGFGLLYNTPENEFERVASSALLLSPSMYPYNYTDFLQLQLNSNVSFDYDFDAHIEQCANVFGSEEKGILQDDRRSPVPIILSMPDGFGSPCSSTSSRSSSIADGFIKSEESDGEDIIVPALASSLPQSLVRGNEGIRYEINVMVVDFDTDTAVDPLMIHMPFVNRALDPHLLLFQGLADRGHQQIRHPLPSR